MVAGLVSKAGATLFYAAALWAYLRFIEPHDVATSEGDVADVFQMLTYRQKYEQARDRMVHDPLDRPLQSTALRRCHADRRWPTHGATTSR